MSRKKLKKARIPKTDWVLPEQLHKEPTIKVKIFLIEMEIIHQVLPIEEHNNF
jgi:diaminopimelate epimerase